MIELAITIKDEHVTFTERHPVYEKFIFSNQSDYLQNLVTEALKKFTGDPQDPDIIIKAKMTW